MKLYFAYNFAESCSPCRGSTSLLMVALAISESPAQKKKKTCDGLYLWCHIGGDSTVQVSDPFIIPCRGVMPELLLTEKCIVLL